MKEQEKVLFVVYRAEWWGCFDSLCRQECEREEVECYVLPIPRYGRDKETLAVNPKEKYFDSASLQGELPAGVQLVEYETFDVEQGFDRIYIHNPYDGMDVTAVCDPMYFSGSLKAHTKKLIYVPHWLYIGGMPEEMTNCPVYNHADAIYLSDDRVRYSLDVAYDEKVEVVPSGILQYLDKLNAQKDNKGEKTSPKRLLYCVSFHDLFYGTEKQIQKMWDIFRYMETRKDITFVFRPDEDIPARYRGLHVEIRRKYEELVAYFKKKQIGIYDETSNPYLAAINADGILSGGHPMDALFSVQGKYVLHIDRESRLIPTEEDRCIPSIWAAAVEETDDETIVWFVPDGSNLICRMRLSEGKVEVEAEVPEEGEKIIVSDVVKVGECLYLSPFLSNGIWRYDLKEKMFSKLYLPILESGGMFRGVSYQRNIYFIPGNCPGIVKYNVETEDVKVIDGWIEEILVDKASEATRPFFGLAVRREENMLYLASDKNDYWMVLNMEDDTWQLQRIGMSPKGFADMEIKGDDVWLIPVGEKGIIHWNRVTKESEAVVAEGETEPTERFYMFLMGIGGHIVAFPGSAEHLAVISGEIGSGVNKVTEGLPCKAEDYISEYIRQQKMGYQFGVRLQGGRVMVYERYGGTLVVLDEELQVLQKVKCRLPFEEVKRSTVVRMEKEMCKDTFAGCVAEEWLFPDMIDAVVSQTERRKYEMREMWRENNALLYEKY